jgi:serine/threonine-protein kinase
MYQKAIESDPDFALAYTRLGMSHLFLYWFYYDRSEDRLMKSKQAIDAAFRIEPELTEAYIALGGYYYVQLDYSQALMQYDKALKKSPNNSECIFWIAAAHRRAGNWEKAMEGFKKAFELDPRSSRVAVNTGGTYAYLDEYPEAIHYHDIAIMLRPDWVRPYYHKSRYCVKWNGDTREARKIIKKAEQIITSTVEITQLRHMMIRLAIYDGNYEEALKYLTSEKSEVYQDQLYFIPWYQYFAKLYGLKDNPVLEYAYYDSARIMLEDMLTMASDDPRLYSSLGITYAGLGFKKEAIEAGEKAVKLLPISKDALTGTTRVENLAQIYVMVGEYEEALKRIDTLLSIPSALSTQILQLDPVWKPLKDNPKFIKLLETYSEN